MHELRLEFRSPSRHGYAIRIGSGALDWLKAFRNRRCLVVSDSHVAPHYLQRVQQLLDDESEALVLPAGEKHKDIDSLNAIWRELATRKLPRDGLLVALGGGVIGDITGFAAATWMRGTPFIQLPTTLLAQVDASVGGKTAINLPDGKNLVGAFHQPEAVLVDTDTLATLPDREYSAGLAEVVKAALISGPGFLDWLQQNREALANREPAVVEEAILRSCQLKADIVTEDERETGRRALLNLGHTFGHAIETGLGHGEWLHGEAVAAGLMLALDLSETVLGLDTGLRPRVAALLEAFDLPVALPPALTAERLMDLMAGDKKVDAAGWKLILVATPGDVRIVRDTREEDIRRVLENPA